MSNNQANQNSNQQPPNPPQKPEKPKKPASIKFENTVHLRNDGAGS